MKQDKKKAVRFVTVNAGQAGQRIDNFLMRELKNVPRSHVYRILRKGEVRVDKKRVKPLRKLTQGEVVRIPPVFLAEKSQQAKAPDFVLNQLRSAIIFEDDDLIFINKPSGLAVHGGSGVHFGLIESFRQLRPELPFIELAHRLDKETSGIVMLAKNRPTLLALHEMMKKGDIQKCYQTLVKGRWQGGERRISNSLLKQRGAKQKVRVIEHEESSNNGSAKLAESIFSPMEYFSFQGSQYSLLNVELITGRMHQIRTQLANLDLPILGDSQYGDFAMNRDLKKTLGLKRLFLHAYSISFHLDSNGRDYAINIPLADDLRAVTQKLSCNK